MTELPLILLGGMLGSAHCLGMCGPLALVLGMSERSVGANFRRQCVFSVGRIFTYAFLGALAGYCGWWLSKRPGALINAQSVLGVVAGVFLITVGLLSTGLVRRLGGSPGKHGGCASAMWLKTFLTAPGFSGALLAGVFTGFLPCGLVYAFLALAAAAADLVQGGAIMATFGLGTLPMMVAAGCGGSLIAGATRRRLLHIAAWAVVFTGVVAMARGISFLDVNEPAVEAACPFCP